MEQQTSFWDLTWNAIHPRNNSFDPAAVRPRLVEVLTQIGSARLIASAPEDKSKEATRISNVIIDIYGPWATGWAFSSGEGGGGGVGNTNNWCCPRHSLFPDGYSADQVEEHADRIIAALTDWRDHLQRLADLFDSMDVPADGEEALFVVRKAVARLVTWVIEATLCRDAWYDYLSCTLSWLLEHQGIEPSQARTIVAQAVNGRFESWIMPKPEAVAWISDELAVLAALKFPSSEMPA